MAKLSNKTVFSSVVLIGGLIIFAYFFKAIITFVKRLTGQTESPENEQVLQNQLSYFNKEQQKVLSWYNKSGYKTQQYYKDIANTLEQLMNQNVTEWEQIFKILAAFTPKGLWLVYVNFGTRLNKEYGNMQGDLYDWIVKESQTPMSFLSPYPAATKALFKKIISMNPKFQ